MKICIVVICGLLFSACAAQLSQEGRMVREIQADWSTKCEFLGVIDASEGTGWDIAGDRRGALNNIRNQTARMRGNSFVLTQSSSNAFRTLIQADAYRCSR